MDDNAFSEVMEVLIGEGLEGLPRIIEMWIPGIPPSRR